MIARAAVLVAVAAHVVSSLAAEPAPPEVAHTVEGFYRVHVADPGGGVPDGVRLDARAPFLSVALHAAIDDAVRYREEFIRTHPPITSADGAPPVIDKPPFVDGDYFSGLFEGPRRFELGAIVPAADDVWNVTVRFEYEAGSPGWTDTVVVTRHAGRFGIDDVIYSGAGPFNPPGRLRERLAERESE